MPPTDIMDRCRAFERQCVVKDERITELEALLAWMNKLTASASAEDRARATSEMKRLGLLTTNS